MPVQASSNGPVASRFQGGSAGSNPVGDTRSIVSDKARRPAVCVRRHVLHELRERAGSETPAALNVSHLSRFGSLVWSSSTSVAEQPMGRAATVTAPIRALRSMSAKRIRPNFGRVQGARPNTDSRRISLWVDSRTKPVRPAHERRFPQPDGSKVVHQIADERLMTITDLSTMLGCRSTPTTAGVIVRARWCTASAAMFAMAAPASRPGSRSRLTAVHHAGVGHGPRRAASYSAA